jgi:2-methylisocitrate lyase-like PEP mutase family enzyme
MDVNRLGEKSAVVRDIVHACYLPVLVDCDDGYGDAKNVTHTIHLYDDLGVSAVFIEDQRSPKKCGHMGGKHVVDPTEMVGKLKTAQAARRDADQLFILARTDSLAVNGLDDALRRGERYLKAGADGVYIEGSETIQQLRMIGREFKGVPLATSILEGGGKTPWIPPDEMHSMGFNMLLYPTSLLFRITKTLQQALADLKAGKPMPEDESVTMLQFEKVVDIAYWKAVEQQALPLGERVRKRINKLLKRAS